MIIVGLKWPARYLQLMIRYFNHGNMPKHSVCEFKYLYLIIISKSTLHVCYSSFLLITSYAELHTSLSFSVFSSS